MEVLEKHYTENEELAPSDLAGHGVQVRVQQGGM